MRRHLLALACAATLSVTAIGPAKAEWDGSYFPNVELVNQDGVTLRFWDDLLRDKIVVVNFVYTDCPDICGLSTARMAQVVDWLGERIGKDIFVYSISLDPGTDTPQRLRDYADAFDAPDGWMFLTGSPENVDIVRFKMGERSESLAQHRSDMVIGNAATGEWRRASLMGSLVVLTEEILSLDPAWTLPPAIASLETITPGQLVIKDTPGEGLFLSACAACHTVGEGIRVGPDLSGVTLRRDREWLKAYLKVPNRMLARKDPVAVELDKAFPAVRMPNLQLNDTDVEDLIHYLAVQTELLGQPQEVAEAAGHDHADHSGHGQSGHTHADGHQHDHSH
ncbi:hypothetical protein GCM10011402_28170 [Paracoccus acridae]|jgi:protein SCO1/2|uniref:Cytochrome c domain-containing protein n=1 Tax=Paracoccus acridae TaxID=1795310 RepID=A0ABQ1VK28_9RHOB|nr:MULTISPECIES: SCO family protein [Paracoccus]GGF73916.1 hypothetical protein GCM10011402_28170 [Paracoccus acridae]